MFISARDLVDESINKIDESINKSECDLWLRLRALPRVIRQCGRAMRGYATGDNALTVERELRRSLRNGQGAI